MKTVGKFKLDGTKVVEVFDLEEWANWTQNNNLQLALDSIGDAHVSTVFLGMDFSNPFDGGHPQLFETAILSPIDKFKVCNRYATYDAAMAGHIEVLNELQSATTREGI